MSMIFLLLVLTYCLLLLALYTFQRRLLYFPDRQLKETSFYHLSQLQVINLTTSDGYNITSWYYPGISKAPTNQVILYCHGNKGHIGDRSEKLKCFLQKGFGILAPSYRGYGSSQGSPTELGLYNDIRAALNFLVAEGIPLEKIILYGESLGSGVAIQMATEFNVGALVLEAPYTSMTHVAQKKYPYVPVRYLLKDRFDSESKIAKVKAPILILHGERDPLIPIDHSKKLLFLATTYKKNIFYQDVNHTSYDPKLLAMDLADFINHLHN